MSARRYAFSPNPPDQERQELSRRRTEFSPWLHRFILILALATLALLGIGGLVTSRGVGLAVPDWPNTYGYNMFAFPVSKWMGGILYEHSHRLMASMVGLLTTVLALWLWIRETRGRQRALGIAAIVSVIALMGIRVLPVYLVLAGLAPVVVGVGLYQIRRQPGSLRWWGMIAFAAVILQGVLGGLRVIWLKDQIGIFHAALAQIFFVLVCALWFFTRKQSSEHEMSLTAASGLRGWAMTATFLIFLQLILGATMRHQHAGLAIPDFPLAYGKLWPPMDPAAVALANQQRVETVALNPITAFQIGLQMFHRLLALAILVTVAACAWQSRKRLGTPAGRLALVWFGLILLQIALGAATIWSNKAADIATAHVLIGALALALGTISSIVFSRGLVPARKDVVAEALTPHPFGPQPSAAASLK